MENQNELNARKKELVELLIRIYKHLPSLISAVADDDDRALLQHIINKTEERTITELYSLK